MKIFLMFILAFYTTFSQAQVIQNLNALFKLLKTKQNWSTEEVIQEKINLSDKDSAKYFKFYSQIECGRGSCDTYIFEQDQSGYFYYLGTIYGRFEIASELKNGMYVIRSTSMIGSQPNEIIKIKWEFDGVKYAPKK